MIARVVTGVALAAAIAFLARQRGVLSTRGSVAAVAIGTLAMSAGARWGVLLILYFAASVLLSAWRRAEKESRTASVVEKSGARDEWQVLANGGVYVIMALAAARSHSEVMSAAALGALAASMADTSATEVGSAIGGQPRSILTWRHVAPGTSGGVTVIGTIAMLAGSAFVALLALLLGYGAAARSTLIAGIAGAMADSLLGSTVQERRRCPACGTLTERRRHNCQPAGVMTDVIGGVRGVDNDWVNLTSTAIGAAAAAFSRGGV